MEGYFRYSGSSKDYIEELKREKEKTIICSLSQSYQDGLMWSFYADEHRGCCIEVEVTSKKDWRRIPINYTDVLPNVDDEMKSTIVLGINYILSTKSKSWRNEKEIRYVKNLKPRSRTSLSIKIHRILLGIRMKKEDEWLIRKVVKLINANQPKDKKIDVVKLKKTDIDFGFSN